jgi:hypothetical protein
MSHQGNLINECLSCEGGEEVVESSFPKTFEFLTGENQSNAEHFVNFDDPFCTSFELVSGWHDDDLEHACPTPSACYEKTNELSQNSTKSEVGKKEQKNETYNSSSSPSSVKTKFLYHNPYLQILRMKEAFEGFQFLLPILRKERKKDIKKYDTFRCDLQIAKQRIASIVLFHGGNVKQQQKSNVYGHQGKKKTVGEYSITLPQLETNVNSYPLRWSVKSSEDRSIFKDLAEKSNSSSTTMEGISPNSNYTFASMGSRITDKRSVKPSPSKVTMPNNRAMVKNLDKKNRKKSIEERDRSITDDVQDEKKIKSTYHCKYCGLPKQKHKCVHRRNIQQSIGIMVRILNCYQLVLV